MLWHEVLNWRTIAMMLSSIAMAVLAVLPATHQSLLPLLYYRLLFFAEALFHEMGHALTSWMLGGFAIPSLLTITGSQNASGVTLMGDCHWYIQLPVLAGLAYLAYHRYAERMAMFWLALAGIALLLLVSFTPYQDALRTYMGHGGSVLAAGWLLYRAWNGAAMRNGVERWLNALVGWFILIDNAHFAWSLHRDIAFRANYEGQVVGSVGHHDFVVLSELLPFTMDTVTLFHIAVGAVTGIVAFFSAAYFVGDEIYG